MESSLEERLDFLYHAKLKRKNFVETLQEEVMEVTKSEVMLPYHCVASMSKIMLDTIKRILKRGNVTKQRRMTQTAIVSAHHHTTRVPLSIKRKDGTHKIRARWDFMGRHEIVEYESSPPIESIDFLFEVHGRELDISYVENEEVRTLHVEEGGYLRSPSVSREIISHSTGSAIRMADRDGKINFGNNQYNFGRENSNQPVLIFFDEGTEEPFFFDVFGNMLFTGTYERGEVSINNRLVRMFDAKKEMDKTNPSNVALLVEKELKEKWSRNPAQFKDGWGIEYWLDGKAIAPLKGKKRSYVEVKHYQRGRKRTFVMASSLCPTDIVELRFKGSYVAVYSGSELVNCHSYSEPFNCKVVSNFRSDNVRKVSLLTFSSTGEYLTRTVGNRTYKFARREVLERYGRGDDTILEFGIIIN